MIFDMFVCLFCFVGVLLGFCQCDWCLISLFDVVVLLLVEKGVVVMSMEDIVECVGVVKSMFYYYFQDWVVMFEVLCKCYLQCYVEVVEVVMNFCELGDWDVCLVVWVQVIVVEYFVIYVLYDVIFYDFDVCWCCVVCDEFFVWNLVVLFEVGVVDGFWLVEVLLEIVSFMFYGLYGLFDEVIVIVVDMVCFSMCVIWLFCQFVWLQGKVMG